MLSQQDQEMRRNVPDPSFAGGSHFCGSGAGNETTESLVLAIPNNSGQSDSGQSDRRLITCTPKKHARNS